MKAPGCDLYLQGCHFLAASELDKVISLFQLMFTFLVDELTQVKQMQTLKVLGLLEVSSPEQEATVPDAPASLACLTQGPGLLRWFKNTKPNP